MAFFSRPATQLPKLTTSAADLAAKSNAAPESQALVKPGMTSGEYIHTLEQNKQSVDAVKGLANGMPEQDSVCWACQSSQKVGDKLNPEEKEAMAAALAWVKDPTDANQAAAGLAASKTDFTGPGGWAAQAAAWAQNPNKITAAGAGTMVAAEGMKHIPQRPDAPSQELPNRELLASKVPNQQLPKQQLPNQQVPANPIPTTAPSLTASAVTGAVLLAAGLLNGKPMSAPQKPDLESYPVNRPKDPKIISTDPSTQKIPQVDQSKMSKSLQPFIDLGKKVATGEVSCKG